MRTTVTIEDGLAAQIEAIRRREGSSFEAALNRLLRLGILADAKPLKPRKFRTPTSKLGLKAGIDPTRLNALFDELDVSDSFG